MVQVVCTIRDSQPPTTTVQPQTVWCWRIVQAQNGGVKPNRALVEQPYQKLRFALIFPPLSLEDKEVEMIRKALQRHNGKRKYAAEDLGISERTLYRKIKEHNLE